VIEAELKRVKLLDGENQLQQVDFKRMHDRLEAWTSQVQRVIRYVPVVEQFMVEYGADLLLIY